MHMDWQWFPPEGDCLSINRMGQGIQKVLSFRGQSSRVCSGDVPLEDGSSRSFSNILGFDASDATHISITFVNKCSD